MVVKVGIKALGNPVLVEDPDQDTKAGEIYRTTFEVSGETADAATLLEQFLLIKSRYPAISITYIEVQPNKIIMEFYDHPVVPIILVLGAIVAAIIVVGLVVIKQIVELIAPIFDNPAAKTGLGLVLIGIGVGGTGYALHRYYGVKKSDYRRAGRAIKSGAQKVSMRLRRR